MQLTGAYLTDADLTDSILTGADLTDTLLPSSDIFLKAGEYQGSEQGPPINIPVTHIFVGGETMVSPPNHQYWFIHLRIIPQF